MFVVCSLIDSSLWRSLASWRTSPPAPTRAPSTSHRYASTDAPEYIFFNLYPADFRVFVRGCLPKTLFLLVHFNIYMYCIYFINLSASQI